jgi:hypothetical protein
MNKISFEIDQEQLDSLIQQTLISDYRSLKIDNRQISGRGDLDDLPEHIREDYYNNESFIFGLESVMKYYIPHDKVKAIIHEEEVKDEFHETADDYTYGAMGDWNDANELIVNLQERVRELENQVAMYNYNRHVDL